jgi:DNA-binding XRE family transcriptional regulator
VRVFPIQVRDSNEPCLYHARMLPYTVRDTDIGATMSDPVDSPSAKHIIFASRLGREMQRLREAAGVSQAELARSLGWETQVISRLETGRGTMRAFHLVLIADALRKPEPNHPAVLLADMLLPSTAAPTKP